MIRRFIFALLIISLLGIGLVQAQTSGGQICIRAFEDRNGNAQDDTNEPRIQRGLSASLADGNGIIMATALMQNSLNAAAGTLCFQRLPAGQYTLRVVSADYTFTTETEFVTAISDTGIQTFPIGGQPIVSAAPIVDEGGDLQLTSTERQNLFSRLIFAAIGAAIVIGAMAVVGAFIYLVFLRRSADSAKYATGSYPAVQSPTSTGSMQPVILPDDTDTPRSTASTPAPVQYEDEDTNQPLRPPSEEEDDFQFTDDPADDDAFFRPPEA